MKDIWAPFHRVCESKARTDRAVADYAGRDDLFGQWSVGSVMVWDPQS